MDIKNVTKNISQVTLAFQEAFVGWIFGIDAMETSGSRHSTSKIEEQSQTSSIKGNFVDQKTYEPINKMDVLS